MVFTVYFVWRFDARRQIVCAAPQSSRRSSLFWRLLTPLLDVNYLLQHGSDSGFKMGDVLDVRKDKVCRGSSPEIVTAYRKRVRDRLYGERMRQRSARGLPLRRPPCISAVTSRADFVSATAKREGNNNLATGSSVDAEKRAEKRGENNGWRGGCDGDGLMLHESGGEPYLALVRAKSRGAYGQEDTRGEERKGVVSAIGSVPFCSQCLGGCGGMCSPDGTKRWALRAGSNGKRAQAEG